MGLLTIIFVLGAIVRVGLGYLRPAAKTRFRNPERGRLATRIERIGDIVVLVTFALMFLFGWRHDPSTLLELFWFICLVGGFGAYALAHLLASRLTVSGLSHPGQSPAARPGPAPRREPSVRTIPADQPTASRPSRPASGGTRPGGAVEARRRPPEPRGSQQSPGEAPAPRPTQATDGAAPPNRPPQRPARATQARAKPPGVRSSPGSGSTQTRSPAPPSTGTRRPATTPVTATRVPSNRDDDPSPSPEAGRPPARRPPGLRRPNPIPPQQGVAPTRRPRTGDQADHKASPDDPTDLGGLP